MRTLDIIIFLYACESWTLTVELEKRTQAFEIWCYRKKVKVSHSLIAVGAVGVRVPLYLGHS